MSLRCDDAKYSTKAILPNSWKIWQTLKFLALGKFSNFLQVSGFRNCQNFPTQELSTLSNCVRPCYHDSVRQLQPSGLQATYSTLICIIIEQPQTVATVYVSKKQEVTGVDGGTKNNWRGRLLKYTDEFTEWTYKCNLCTMLSIRHQRQNSATQPRPL